MVDALADSILFRLDTMSVYLRRILWLKCWSAKLLCKKKLRRLPFHGKCLFGLSWMPSFRRWLGRSMLLALKEMGDDRVTPFGIQEVFSFVGSKPWAFNRSLCSSSVTLSLLGLDGVKYSLQLSVLWKSWTTGFAMWCPEFTNLFCCFMCSKIPSVPQTFAVFLAALERVLSLGHYTRARRSEISWLLYQLCSSSANRRHLAYSVPQGSCQISEDMEIQVLIYLVSDCFALPVGFIYSDIRKMPTCTSRIFQSRQQVTSL